jgi:outer membrane receptor for ferrienterochelin and colicin
MMKIEKIKLCSLRLFIVMLGMISGITMLADDIYNLSGHVIDKTTRKPVANAYVGVYGMQGFYTSTDSSGNFEIKAVPPGIYKLQATCMGFKSLLSAEYIIAPQMPLIELELDETAMQLNEITVSSTSFRKIKESPVSMQIIGLHEIEKSPGGNRDISRIIRSYPGVSFSVGGYRNDLIVRGGAPSENRFYLDGVEIPNINHFATQGASGGAVSILNADLIREVQFYTGMFPADKEGAMSSVMDIRLRDGNIDKHSYKATIGASEFSLSGTEHYKENTTFLFSVRQSYLQMLFKLFGLPFLPNFIDCQLKVKSRITPHDEITVVGLAGIDDMKLNKDEKGEDAEYILSYLPRIKQRTMTGGAVYKHYAGENIQSVTLSYNYLRNENLKYTNNDESSEDNKTLDLKSTEQKVTLKAENRRNGKNWTIATGMDGYYSSYYNKTFQRLFVDTTYISQYMTKLGIFGWGLYASARYRSSDEKVTITVGARFDGSDYSAEMSRFWKHISPRISFSYRFKPSWSINLGAGMFNQLPAYTSLGYKDSDGLLLNKDLKYMIVRSGSAGIEYNNNEMMVITAEGFYKRYVNAPLSINDQIPLACKGNDYGIVGNELLAPTAEGRAYGVEASIRWQIPSKFYLVSSVTLYKSEYRNDKNSKYIASAWDNKFIINLLGTYNMNKGWSCGMKFSAIGGAPDTPYDLEKSSLVEAWNVRGRPYFDYSKYNQFRNKTYAQLDLRVDKMLYFHKWMLGFYLDIQNVTKSTYREQDIPMSTGVIENPQDSPAQQRYKMKYIKQESGSMLPTIGATVQF